MVYKPRLYIQSRPETRFCVQTKRKTPKMTSITEICTRKHHLEADYVYKRDLYKREQQRGR